MKKNEIETVTVFNVNLDVYFTYNKDFGFEIDSIEDETGVQNLMPILNEFMIEAVENKLHSLYEKRGWL